MGGGGEESEQLEGSSSWGPWWRSCCGVAGREGKAGGSRGGVVLRGMSGGCREARLERQHYDMLSKKQVRVQLL